MDFIFVGDIVNTHGLKGEVRLISDFKFKKEAFKDGMSLYIGKDKKREVIKSYRIHKDYDMLSFEGIRHIEDVLIYKGEPAYINRADLVYEGYLNEDLISLDVYCNDKKIGHIDSILKTNAHEILVIKNGSKHMVPNLDEFIEKVDLNNKKIYIKYIKGLLNED